MKLQAAEIGHLAVRAMQLELWATPKPGLVDRQNSGAHQDMDYQTFEASIAALEPHMKQFAQIGEASVGDNPAEAFARLRRQGIQAEQAMFAATRGVNTHKGTIFTLGLLCGAAGRLLAADPARLTPDRLGAAAAAMTAGLCARELSGLRSKDQLSHGERTYLAYGATGIRGEAESGYASIRSHAYPLLAAGLRRRADLNDLLVQVLLQLMAAVEDTNVLARHGPETARYVQEQARRILNIGSAETDAGMAAVRELDREFIVRQISPGGCADLLAATIFIWLVCHPGEGEHTFTSEKD